MREPAWWRVLRSLLPVWYRTAYAEEVLRAHLDAAGGKPGLRFWLRLSWDIVLTAVQLHLDGVVRVARVPRRRSSALDVVAQNVRISFRGLVHTPGFTLAVVLTLALGIGANTTMFTILDRLLLSAPAHVVDADQVRKIMVYGKSSWSISTGEPEYNAALTYPDYRDLAQVSGFAAIAAYGARTLTLTGVGETERVAAEFATASYFPLLGVKPELGRFFTADEDQLDVAEATAVLSFGFWQRRFGGDRGVLGRRLELGKGRYTVIGVAPRGFTGVEIVPVDVWVPFHAGGVIESGREWVDARGWFWFGAVARLDPRYTEAQLLGEATARYRAGSATERNRDQNAEVRLTSVVPGRGPEPTPELRVAQALGVLALLVLLIACANVANLFLARGLQRRKQFAVQSALGISRARLIAQVLTEALMLSVVSGALAYYVGVIVAPALFRVILVEAELAAVGGSRVLLMTFLITLFTVVLAGLIPALRSSRVDVLEALRSGRSSLRLSWLRRGLLSLQAALSVVLLVGAGLFLRSLQEAHRRDLGLATDVVTIDLELEGGNAFGEKLAAAVYPVLERLQQHPLVESAAATSLIPFSGFWGLQVRAPGGDSVPSGPNGPLFVAATADYFRTMRIPLLRGRGLTSADDVAGAPAVAVVNERMARSLWPGRDAIGQCILIGPAEPVPPCTTVVGIVGDVLPYVTATEPRMAYYVAPHHPGIGFVGAQALVVRVKGDPPDALDVIRSVTRTAAPGIRFVDVATLEQRIEPQLRSWKLGARLLSAFGLLALIVAASGLYSLLAFDVTQRRFELGLRSALGAPAQRLVRATVGEELTFAVLGVVVGLAAALVLARAVQELLFQVTPADPIVYAGVIGVLLAVTAAAAALPACRAARSDPRVALRAE